MLNSKAYDDIILKKPNFSRDTFLINHKSAQFGNLMISRVTETKYTLINL